MKRDKKWFVDKLTKKRDRADVHDPIYHFINELISDVNQLDGLETLSQEWIYENKEMYLINDTSENAVPEYKLQNLIVPKQVLAVIPQWVADWFEENKEHFEDRLKSAIKYREINDDPSEFDVWLDNPHNKPLQTLGNMFNGYEVEEEQKYYVLDSEDIPLLERVGNQIQRTTTELSIYEKGRDNSRFELTEQEIKGYDERYWAFRKPV